MNGPDRAVILAGGGGTRLWPWTGPDLPKPLLPLGGGGRSLLRATLERLDGLVDPAGVTVLAAPGVAEQLLAGEPRLDRAHVWSEPSPRDTGPAIAYAMRRVVLEAPEQVVAILPADHRIDDVPAFHRALSAAAEAARAGELALLGIAPGEPSTRFGYLDLASASAPVHGPGPPVLPVGRFVEKPDAARAVDLVARGALWNAGMFVWRADVFWAALEAHAPGIAGPVAEVVDGGATAAWDRATKTSIDFGLMERVPRAVAVPLAAGWDDVGGWDAVLALAARGDAGPAAIVPLRGTAPEGSAVLRVGPEASSAGRAIALGDRPVLVVIGPEGILVAPRDAADGVKPFV